MNDQDKQKVVVGIANSFLQAVTVNQTLAILQEKAIERANEEVGQMEDAQLEEVLTNIRAQEIARELREESTGSEESSKESPEEVSNQEVVTASETSEEEE